jgi:hypothetical protein
MFAVTRAQRPGGQPCARGAGATRRLRCRARAVQQALGPLLGKALPPCAESRIGNVEGRGDGGDAVACDDCTDGLGPAKSPGLLRLREPGR